jgi:hypothetical protein
MRRRNGRRPEAMVLTPIEGMKGIEGMDAFSLA